MRNKRPFPPTTYFLIILLLLLAFWLRLHNIDAFSFWTDEGLTPLRSSYSVSEILSNRIIIQEGITNDTHPPLFYLIIHFSRQLFGETDFAFRFPSTLAGVLLVPLMFQFGKRLGGIKLAGIVGMLTAVNPLQISYAQEARMYTLLILLAAASSYFLWQMLITNKWRYYWFPYILLTGLAIYTHYFAVFLIAAQSLFVAQLLWRNGQRRMVAGTAISLFLIALPLIPITVPRLFSGAEAAYFHVPPLVIFQDAVYRFSLGVTVNYSQPLIQLLVSGTAILFVIGIITLQTWLQRLFLLSYLFAAPVGIAILSIIKPMYLGVRHIMIGSPALLLILAQAIIWLATAMKKSTSPYKRLGWGVAVAVAMLILSISSMTAINNLYNDGSYAKDNFRDLIQYIEQHAGENDVVVYNDAILLATHAHYQQRDLPVTAVPIYYRHAQNSMEVLPELAAQYDRIWFLPDPPDDGRDANKLVQTWLDDNLSKVDSYSGFGNSALIQVVAYATTPPQTAVLPTTAHPYSIEWDNLPTLTGIDAKFNQPTRLATLWIELFWQGDQPTPDQQIRFILRGNDGGDWVMVQRPFTTIADWATNQLMRQSYSIAIPAGTPPGEYNLLIQPIGEEARPVTTIVLDASNWLPDEVKRPFNSPAITFQNGLTLFNITHPHEVRPGHSLPLTLYWQANAPSPSTDLQYDLRIVAPDGTLFQQLTGKPAPEWAESWPEHSPIVAYTGVHFPPDTPPGRYQLRWQLRDGDGVVKGRPFLQPFYREQIDFGAIDIIPWPLVTILPDDAIVVQAQFGDEIELYGYDLEQSGNALNITLYWQATTSPTINHFSFVHLLDADGEIVAQQAFVPVSGLRPTMGWRAGELLSDTYTIELTSDIPSGQYTLLAGLFEPETGKRPFVTHQNQHQADDQFILETITIP